MCFQCFITTKEKKTTNLSMLRLIAKLTWVISLVVVTIQGGAPHL